MIRLSRLLLGGLFVGAGVLHFVRPAPFEAIVPPSLPARRTLVLVSGGAEILGGLGLLSPWRWARRTAGWGLAALLVAVFPANVYMATAKVGGFPAWALWARLPLQGLLVAWALRAGGVVRGSRLSETPSDL